MHSTQTRSPRSPMLLSKAVRIWLRSSATHQSCSSIQNFVLTYVYTSSILYTTNILQLYYTGAGPAGSAEEEFPDPNNLQKMRRSIENAEHVGLFRHHARFTPDTSPDKPLFPRSPSRGYYDRPAKADLSPTKKNTPPPTPALPTTQLVKVDTASPTDAFACRTERVPAPKTREHITFHTTSSSLMPAHANIFCYRSLRSQARSSLP